MDFYFQIIGSALFAGFVAICVTVAIEKFGGVVGGILGTIPTTIVPAAIGIYLSADNSDAYLISMCIVPIGMFLNACFLGVWKIIPGKISGYSSGKKLSVTLLAALTFWVVAGVLMIWFSEELLSRNVDPLTIAIVATACLLAMGILVTWRGESGPRGNREVSSWVLLLRGLAAAIAIGVAVWLSGVGLPLLSGLISVFPAIFLTSMVALWISQGEDVPTGAAGPMMLGGGSVSAYAIVAMWSLPVLGVWVGSAVAWVGSIVLWSLPAWAYVNSRRHLHKPSSRE